MRRSIRCGQESRHGRLRKTKFVTLMTVVEPGGVGLSQGPTGKSQGGQEAEDRGGHLNHDLYWDFHGKGEAGKVDSLWPAGMINLVGSKL